MPSPSTPHQPSASDQRHVLVVDDDPLFRSLMISVLRRDFSVEVAGDGADGYYRALAHIPAAAVLDIQMPGWDGLRTLKAFRSHPALEKVKVVVLTSDASRETLYAAIQAGADDYIVKTAFSRDEFRQKLDTMLSQNRSARPHRSKAHSEHSAPESSATVGAPQSTESWLGSISALEYVVDAWE